MSQNCTPQDPPANGRDSDSRGDGWVLTRRGRALLRLARGEALEEVARDLEVSCNELHSMRKLLLDGGE